MFILNKNPERQTVDLTVCLDGTTHTASVTATQYLSDILEVSSKLLAIETAENPQDDPAEQVDRCLRKAKLLLINAIVLTAEDSLQGIEIIAPQEPHQLNNRQLSDDEYRQD